ncbi:hypothetical protein RN001_005237 [Aquatica leii]|uniref:Uncharacterized protein n=1 Tax=Aquatica leii TaxID=1421715 RepID=A0AAN7PCH7_9COLE|nr:hypothetical protein RN001_005237 [Aquatica leii]
MDSDKRYSIKGKNHLRLSCYRKKKRKINEGLLNWQNKNFTNSINLHESNTIDSRRNISVDNSLDQSPSETSLQRWRSHKQNPTQEETVQVSSEQHGYEHQPPQDDLDQIPPSHEEAPMQVTSTAPDLQPSTSEPIPESNVSFEAILLKTVNKRNSENLIRKPKRKVCNGAEVVTSKDVLQRFEQLDKMKNKSKPKKPPVVEEITSDEEDENEVLTESEEEVNMNFVEEFEEMEQD